MKWIDSHAHIDLMNKNDKQIINDAIKSDIVKIINISTEINSYFNGKKLSLENKNIVFTTCGLYPSNAEYYNKELRISLISQLKERIAVGIGEIGLDYYWNYSSRDKQVKLFNDQLCLAKDFNLPVVIHARESYEDVYKVLKKESPLPGGVMHCYCGNESFVNKFMELGFYISFAGNITYKKAYTIQRSCKAVPLERIVLETDSPYLSPIPFRGKKNEPKLLIHTAKFISNLKNESLNSLSMASYDNTNKLFNLL